MSALALSIGYVAGAIGFVTNVPQAVKIWRSGSDVGINAPMWVLYYVGFAAWLGYGLRVQNAPVIASNVGMSVVVASVLLAIGRARSRRLAGDVVLLVLIAAPVVAVAHVVPVPILVAYFVATGLVPWMQVLTSIRTVRQRSASNVSVATLAIRCCGMSLWLTHGLMVGDAAIVVSISVAFVATALTLALELLGGRRRATVAIAAV